MDFKFLSVERKVIKTEFFNVFLIFFSILLLVLSVSCSSTKGVNRISGEALMYGMVYNYESIPVSGAEVIVDEKIVTLTDAQGRFILSSRQRNDFTLTLNKSGYEQITRTYRFEPMEVIHIVMVNASQLVNQAELAMDEGRFQDVVKLCDRAIALNQERADAHYLKALSLVRLKDFKAARIILEELQNQIGKREYIQQVLDGLPQL